MKHVKILGLLAMAAASLMAFAGSASAAPTLTSPKGTEYTGELHMTLEPGTSLVLKAGIEWSCTESTVKGKVEVNNETEVEGKNSIWSFGNCTKDTNVRLPGSLTITNAGTVFTKNSRIEIVETTIFGNITCFYGAETKSVDIGTLTDSSVTGSTATLDLSTTELQREAGSNTSFCNERATWTGKYLVTTPDQLFLK